MAPLRSLVSGAPGTRACGRPPSARRRGAGPEPESNHQPSHARRCVRRAALKAGDTILSIDGVVPASPKHAVQLISQAEYIVNVVVVGHQPDGA